MIDFESLAQRAQVLALTGDRDAALAQYEQVLAVIESGTAFYGEAEVRSAYAQLLHETSDLREGPQLTKAAALFQRRGESHALIDVCLRMARLSQRATTLAVYWTERAVAAAERSGSAEELCLPLALRGELLLAAGRVPEALEALERVVELPGGEAYADTLASAQIANGHSEIGLQTLARSLADAERDTGPDAVTRVVSLSIRLADARRALHERTAALDILERAATCASELSDGRIFAAFSDRLGAAQLEAGDPFRSAATLERGIEGARSEKTPDAGQLASLYNNLGNALADLGNHAGARRSFEEAIRLAHAHGGVRSEALSLFGFANLAVRVDDADVARHSYEEARALAVRLGDRSLEAACLDSLGQLLVRQGEPHAAIDLHRRAAELHRTAADHKAQHVDLMNLVQTYLLIGELGAARDALDQARALAVLIGRLPWQHALNEGQVLAREGRWSDARSSFDAAIAQLEAERRTLQTPADQRRWAAQRVEAFEISAAAAFTAGDAMAALTCLEGNRARFLEAVADDRRRLPSTVSADDRRAYVAATNRLAELRHQRRERPDHDDPTLDTALDEATRTWETIQAGIEQERMHTTQEAAPAEATGDAQTLRLAESLEPGEAAVALHVTDNWLGAVAVGRQRNGLLWWDIATDAGFSLAELSRMVVGRGEGDAEATWPAWLDLTSLPRTLAEHLIAGVLDRLGIAMWPIIERVVQDRADALVLMPGRGLNVLPLHAACTPDGRRLQERWSIRYVPSLKVFAGAGSPGALPKRRVLGQAVNPSGDLPLADAESAAVRANWRGEHQPPLTGPEAEPEGVLRFFTETDVLHFAGHGAFDAIDPLQSRLSCTPTASGSTITLQMLLERLPSMRTRVVLLSACETGRVVAGDPLNDQLGLPGGLLIAGAGAVLATFWRVDDLAACLVLSRCVEVWERPAMDLDRALADAQRWLRTEATAGVIRNWLEARLDADPPGNPHLEEAHGRLAALDEDLLPYASAYYWAPFHVSGRAIRTC